MKNKILIIFSILFLSKSLNFAQNDQSSFGISFSGYIKTDLLFDSRQTISFREGHFLLYPAPEKLDSNNNDINAKSNLNMLSIQTRLLGKITGPDAFKAKTSGLIEGEFFGTTDADANGFRIRQAFLKLDWEKTSLLIGQMWHPMLVTDIVSGVVSFNTGVPFQPFSRNPQIRLIQTFTNLKLIAVAASQRDFQSFGPDKDNGSMVSSSYLRNSVLPNLHLQMQYKLNDNLFCLGLDYKKLTPRLETFNKKFKTNETIHSFATVAYFKLNFNSIIVKGHGTLGENLSDLLMLGGYAVKSRDSVTGFEKYTPISCLSMWGEISYGKDVEFGIFGGYTKNLGARDHIHPTLPLYTRTDNLADLLRISPRIQWHSGKTRISTELEYTSAGYGKVNKANKGKVENVKRISNTRLLAAVYYFF